MGRSERKAIFAGRFDPFHSGHAYAVERSLEIVDTVLVYVSNSNSNSHAKIFAKPETRADIVRAWLDTKKFKGEVKIYFGDKKHVEFHREGYDVEICGSDVFNYYKNYEWKSFRLTREFIVLPRKRWGLTMAVIDEYLKGGGIIHIIPGLNAERDFSSTHVRHMIQHEERISGLVPAGLERHIREIYEPLLTGP